MSEKPARALLLLRAGDENFLLIKKVKEIIPICGVVWERKGFAERFRVVWRRRKKIGIIKVIDQLLYLVVRDVLSLLGFYPSIIKVDERLKREAVEGLDCLVVGSVNDRQVLEFAGEKKPDVVIVSGTGILKKDLIDALKVPIINYHAGITPEYRGVYGAFWALLEGKPSLVGSTIHLIDPGIDTGAILRQERIEIDLLNDTHLSLFEKQFLKALELIEDVLKEFLSRGKLEGWEKKGARSQLYYHPGLTELIKFWIQIGIR